MQYEKRISNYNDFKKWLEEINYLPVTCKDFDIPDASGIKSSTASGSNLNGITNMANKIRINEKWRELLSSDEQFYSSNGYIEVKYDDKLRKFSTKERSKGRPSVIAARNKNVTVRMSDHELELLDNYCSSNTIKRSEAIRLAVDRLLNK